MFSKKIIILLFITFSYLGSKGQAITNGNFSGGTTGWACGAETNAESVYGGPTSNAVAEVDAAAGLCQTLTGLTIGNAYVISFQASRRTGGCPSPATTNVVLTVSGGVLSTVVTRTNTTFGYTTSSYLFTANATSHTIDFAAGTGFGGSTCGMIIDNIAVAFSPLPIELLSFNGKYKDGVLEFEWKTASEKNNAFFEIEKSSDGIHYEKIGSYPSKASRGNSNSILEYKTNYSVKTEGVNYYRLKQTDFDQQFSYSPVIVISSVSKQNFVIQPNPNSGIFSIKTSLKGQLNIALINAIGEQVYSSLHKTSEESSLLEIKTAHLAPGFYYCVVSTNISTEYAQLIIQ